MRSFNAFCRMIAVAAILVIIASCSKDGNQLDKQSVESASEKEQPQETVKIEPSHPIEPSQKEKKEEEEEEEEEPVIDYDVKESFEKAVRLYDMQSYDDSIGWFSKVIEKDPEKTDAYLFRGIAYYKKGLGSKAKDVNKSAYEMDQALENLSRVLEKEPNNVNALEHRGLAYYEKGKHVILAVSDFSKLIEIIPGRAESYYYRGNANYQGGYIDEAIADYQTSIDINPDYIESYRKLLWIYELKEEYDKALDFYNLLATNHFKNAKPYYYRGLIHYKKGNYADALLDFEKALFIDPDYAEAREWQVKALKNRGQAR